MNVHMWEHPATRKNAEILKQRKRHHIFGPAEAGILACGAAGAGKLMPVELIVEKRFPFCSKGCVKITPCLFIGLPRRDKSLSSPL